MIQGNKGQAGPLQKMIIGFLLFTMIAGLGFFYLSGLSSEYDITLQQGDSLQVFSDRSNISAIIGDTQNEFVGDNNSQQVDEDGGEDTNIFRSALRISKVVMALPEATMVMVNQGFKILLPDDLEPLVLPVIWLMLVVSVLFAAIALILRWRG